MGWVCIPYGKGVNGGPIGIGDNVEVLAERYEPVTGNSPVDYAICRDVSYFYVIPVSG